MPPPPADEAVRHKIKSFKKCKLIKVCAQMKRLLLLLSIIFIILTFAGAVFVFTSNGAANAGYAVIPMMMTLACLSGYKVYTNKR